MPTHLSTSQIPPLLHPVPSLLFPSPSTLSYPNTFSPPHSPHTNDNDDLMSLYDQGEVEWEGDTTFDSTDSGDSGDSFNSTDSADSGDSAESRTTVDDEPEREEGSVQTASEEQGGDFTTYEPHSQDLENRRSHHFAAPHLSSPSTPSSIPLAHSNPSSASSTQPITPPPSLPHLSPTLRTPLPLNNVAVPSSSHAPTTFSDDQDELLFLLQRGRQQLDSTLEAPKFPTAIVEPPPPLLENHNSADALVPQAPVSNQATPEDISDLPCLKLNALLNEDVNEPRQSTQADWSPRKRQAVAYLESIPLSILDQLLTSVEAIARREAFQRMTPRQRQLAMADGGGVPVGEEVGVKLSLRNRKTGDQQVIVFPDDPNTKPAQTAMHRLSCIMRVGSLLYEAVLTDVPTTKRDIYYKDKALFRSQTVVDKLVDDIVASAGLKRADFNVCATAKGLVASADLKIRLKGGEYLSLTPTTGTLIPPIERIDMVTARYGIDWILIVEKDAVFLPLCGAGLLRDPRLPRGVLITGKGYPDLATLQLTHLLSDTYPSARIFALVDADPHGLDILSVYTRGSKATRFAGDYADLALGEKVQWMGVKLEEVKRLGISYDELLPLSDRDVGKAQAMLRDPDLPSEWRSELCRMLHLRRKAEIEILSARPSQGGSALDELLAQDLEMRGDNGGDGGGSGDNGDGGTENWRSSQRQSQSGSNQRRGRSGNPLVEYIVPHISATLGH